MTAMSGFFDPSLPSLEFVISLSAARTVFIPSSQIVGSASVAGLIGFGWNLGRAPTPKTMVSTSVELMKRVFLTAEMSLMSPWITFRLEVRVEDGMPAASRSEVSFEGVRTTVRGVRLGC